MCRLRLALLLLAAALVVRSDIVRAAGGETYTLPMGRPKSGLRITFDCRGVDGNGYRPIRVTVVPLSGKPWPADRQLRIVILPYSYYHQTSPKVSQIIELPEGGTSAAATIAMPQLGAWDTISIETYENGRLLRDLSQESMGWSATNFWDWTEARPAILMLDSAVPPPPVQAQLLVAFRGQGGTDPNPTYDLPDFRSLAGVFPDPNRGGPLPVPSASPKISDTALLAQAAELSRFNLIRPPSCPSGGSS